MFQILNRRTRPSAPPIRPYVPACTCRLHGGTWLGCLRCVSGPDMAPLLPELPDPHRDDESISRWRRGQRGKKTRVSRKRRWTFPLDRRAADPWDHGGISSPDQPDEPATYTEQPPWLRDVRPPRESLHHSREKSTVVPTPILG